jgi:hypothetical protein
MRRSNRRLSWPVGLAFLLLTFGLVRSVLAKVVEKTQDLSVAFTFLNPCTGNTDSFSGTFHVISTLTFDQAGGAHGNFKVHSSDAKVDDPTFGQCSAQDQGPYKIDFSGNNNGTAGGSLEDTFRMSFRVECPEASNNLEVSILSHFTINANGTTTVSFEDDDAACQ